MFRDLMTIYGTGIRLVVKARPRVMHSRVPCLVLIGDGKRAVEIAVAAVAEDGKANKAIAYKIAEALGLKKSAVSVKTGATGRLKVFEIEGDPLYLQRVTEAWLLSLDQAKT